MLRSTLMFATFTVVSSLLLITDAMAVSQRTFVSGTGVDVGSCPPTAPCRSFGYAIMQTNSGGEVIVLDSAGYGPVVISQSVSITAPSGIYAGISVFSGDGVTINVPGGVVRLVGLTVSGLGGTTGINVLAVARASIERCQVSNLTGYGIFGSAGVLGMEIKESIVANNGAGGLGVSGSKVLVTNSRFLSNTGDGVNVGGGATVTLRDVDASGNSVGGASSFASSGFYTSLHIEGGTFNSNTSGGVAATATGTGNAVLSVTRATLSANGGPGILSGTVGGSAGTMVAVTANAVSDNSTGLAATGAVASIMATGNTVARNGVGAIGQSGGQVYVGGDNSIGFNGTNIGPGVSSYTRN